MTAVSCYMCSTAIYYCILYTIAMTTASFSILYRNIYFDICNCNAIMYMCCIPLFYLYLDILVKLYLYTACLFVCLFVCFLS